MWPDQVSKRDLWLRGMAPPFKGTRMRVYIPTVYIKIKEFLSKTVPLKSTKIPFYWKLTQPAHPNYGMESVH